METWWMIILLVLSYLVGSLPTGYLVGRLKGVDIRKIGSGATGGTNVARVFGWNYGILVGVVDGLKCFLFSAIAYWVLGSEWLALTLILLVLAGNIFPCFLRFKGGKGVATIVGGLLALPIWWIWPPLLAGWVIILFLGRKMSLTNLIAVLLLPLLIRVFQESLAILLLGALAIPIIYFSHRENIARLLQGREPDLLKAG